ncbi:MAG: hypothetical protein ACYC2H_09630 [Thermoplasmatota archaeon]
MRLLATTVLVLLAITSAAQAKPQLGIQNPEGAAPVTLYMHLLGFQDFPINTQVPDPRFTQESGVGLATNTFTCAPNPPMSNALQENHVYRGYSSASYVEYDFMQDGKPRVHPERGFSHDVRLDPAAPMSLQWYLETTGGIGPLDALPLVVPGVVVKATIRASDGLSVDDTAYDTGPIIAQGQSPPALLAADATQGAEHSMARGRHVYGITVPLEVEQATIPKSTGYTLRIDVFLDNPACADPDQGSVMTNSVQPYIDPEHLPRIEASVKSQLGVGWLVPELEANGTGVALRANVTSAWGAYDVDEDNLTLRIEGPDGGTFGLSPAQVIQRTHEHNHVTEPVLVTWRFETQGATPGFYAASLNATNDQHTAVARATAGFQLGPDAVYPVFAGEPVPDLTDGQAMPSMGVPALLAVLGVAVLAWRRRFP